MGFMEALRAFLGGPRETPLVDYPAEVNSIAVDFCEVNVVNLDPDTDEKLVIVTLPLAAFELIQGIRDPLRLTPPDGRAVTFVPVDIDANPALDPTVGWIIPVNARTAAELRGLPATVGEYELASLHLALVVEERRSY